MQRSHAELASHGSASRAGRGRAPTRTSVPGIGTSRGIAIGPVYRMGTLSISPCSSTRRASVEA